MIGPILSSIYSEWRKISTVKVWWGLLICAFVLTLLYQLAILSAPVGATGVTVGSSAGYVFVIILGSIIVTTEYRHATARPTFLGQPIRAIVLAAKAVAGAGMGVVYGLACAVGAMLVILIFGPIIGHAVGFTITLSQSGVMASVGEGIVTTILCGFVGVAFGTVVKNQIAAVIIPVIYLIVVRSILLALIYVYNWHITDIVPGGPTGSGASDLNLLLWGLFLFIVGTAITTVRDIP